MLKSLYIDNYALIENLKIDFGPGFSIITGETGAGKSILMGALSLIIGKRADTSILYDRTKKCVVEAVFFIGGYDLKNFFSQNDIDYDEKTTIRREINAAGKSRAFINDTPVNLETLTDLTYGLIDIHSQHENLSLNDNQYQLNVIDIYGNHQDNLKNYRKIFDEYLFVQKEYNEAAASISKIRSDFDYIQFQFNQIDQAKLYPNEQEELELESEQLNHAGEIKYNLENATAIFSGEEDGLLAGLKSLRSSISKVYKYFKDGAEIEMRLENAFIELKDIAAEVEDIQSRISVDPQRLEFVTQRLDLIFGLVQKHNVKTVEELIDIKNSLQQKIEAYSDSDFRLEELEKKKDRIYDELQKSTAILTEKRASKFEEIQDKVISLLFDLGIPNANFKIQRTELDEYTPNGKDLIRFMFSANKNAPLQELARVASGGELSRFMLAVKSLIAGTSGLPTIIFDEIDMGVSGEIADKVGEIIRQMSKSMQVLNITHLPQIAGKGDFHFLVYKKDNEISTKTFIRQLSPEERILEIAKMLSGKELTEAALKNARELLKG
jgi:DNA repair protein RecN (Recombination protein N)